MYDSCRQHMLYVCHPFICDTEIYTCKTRSSGISLNGGDAAVSNLFTTASPPVSDILCNRNLCISRQSQGLAVVVVVPHSPFHSKERRKGTIRLCSAASRQTISMRKLRDAGPVGSCVAGARLL